MDFFSNPGSMVLCAMALALASVRAIDFAFSVVWHSLILRVRSPLPLFSLSTFYFSLNENVIYYVTNFCFSLPSILSLFLVATVFPKKKFSEIESRIVLVRDVFKHWSKFAETLSTVQCNRSEYTAGCPPGVVVVVVCIALLDRHKTSRWREHIEEESDKTEIAKWKIKEKEMLGRRRR